MDRISYRRILYVKEYISSLIEEGKNERAKSMLKEYPHLCNSTEGGYTLLYYCAIYNNEEIAHYLLQKDCNIDFQDEVGHTALMIAVLTKSSAVAKILLSAGANFDSLLDNQKQSVLHLTLHRQEMSAEFLVQLLTKFRNKFTTSEETAEKLLSFGPKLYQLVCLKDVKIILFLLSRGHSPNSKNNNDQLTALHYGVYFEATEVVKLLLQNGASATALDSNGRMPLYYLYYRNREPNREKLEISKTFLDYGILTTSCVSTTGVYQFSDTLKLGDRESVRLILQSYPDFKAKDKFSEKTLLHYLAKNRNAGVIEELKLHIDKFDVNAVDGKNRNVMHSALISGNAPMVEYLVLRSAAVKFDFDSMPKKISYRKVKFIIALLTMLEQSSNPVIEINWPKTNSQSLKIYFNKCRQVLQTNIFREVTLFKLLFIGEKKIVSYINRRKLKLKLNRISFKQKLKYSFPYYYHTIKKRVSQGIIHKTLKDNAAKILTKISENRLNEDSLVLDKIMNYLNDEDLRVLLQV